MRNVLVLIVALLPFTPLQAESTDHYDRVTITVERQREVANELMQLQLAVELERDDPAALADETNRAMAWALKRVKREQEIVAKSGGYSTYPLQRKGRQIGWRSSQSLNLESANVSLLSTLAGELQEKLVVKSVSFSITEATRHSEEAALIEEVMHAFTERAELVQKTLGAAGYRLVELNLGSSGGAQPRQRMMMAESFSRTAAPVAVESGNTRLTSRATGVIELQR